LNIFHNSGKPHNLLHKPLLNKFLLGILHLRRRRRFSFLLSGWPSARLWRRRRSISSTHSGWKPYLTSPSNISIDTFRSTIACIVASHHAACTAAIWLSPRRSSLQPAQLPCSTIGFLLTLCLSFPIIPLFLFQLICCLSGFLR
jgi:ABC-type uncharacterized transport system permease subunit